ncbi:MAG: SDR family NAD(P)-dependent oxidoreductase, partial [Pirellula sp.]
MIDLQGTTALVTGSTQGVGASIARWLAKAGSKVILHGVALDDHAHETLEVCRKFNPDCKLVSFDLSVPISEVLDRFVQPLIC